MVILRRRHAPSTSELITALNFPGRTGFAQHRDALPLQCPSILIIMVKNNLILIKSMEEAKKGQLDAKFPSTIGY